MTDTEIVRSALNASDAEYPDAWDAFNRILAEHDTLRDDAKRYQWLRANNGLWQVRVAIMRKEGDDHLWVHANEGLDAAIDAARNKP